MRSGKYIGSAFPDLTGKRALVEIRADEKVVAQFDGLELMPWCFGWHEFPARDFQMEEDNSSWCGNDSSAFRHLYDENGF